MTKLRRPAGRRSFVTAADQLLLYGYQACRAYRKVSPLSGLNSNKRHTDPTTGAGRHRKRLGVFYVVVRATRALLGVLILVSVVVERGVDLLA